MLRAITEALESVASSEARVAIVVRALGRAGLAKVPERGPELIRFVDGPLLDAIQELLGAEIAGELVDQLKPVLRFAARPPSIRAARPPSIRSLASAAYAPARVGASWHDGASATAHAHPGAHSDVHGEAHAALRPGAACAGAARAGQPRRSCPRRGRPRRGCPRRDWPRRPSSGARRSRSASCPATNDRRCLPPRGLAQAARPRFAPPHTLEPPRVVVEHQPASASGTRSAKRLPAARTFLVATLDDALSTAAEQVVSAHVRIVRGLFELVDALDDLGGEDATLVHDCTSPAVHVVALLALSEDLPERMSVVLLGPSALDLEALATSPERTGRWLQVDRLAPHELAASLAIAGAPPMPAQSAPSSSSRR